MSADRPALVSIAWDVPRLLLQYAASRGVDVAAICRAVGLPAERLPEREGRLAFERFDALWQAVARQVADPAFGLHFGEAAAGFASRHVLFLVMMNCATVGAALERFCRYHGLMVEGAVPRLTDEGPRRIFRLDRRWVLNPEYAEGILAMLALTLAHLTEQPLRPVAVALSRCAPRDRAEHERIFAAPVLFDQPDDCLSLDRGALARPVFLADPALLATLEQFAQSLLARLTLGGSWSARVSEIIGQRLLQGQAASLAQVAGRLAVSPRLLQTKLRFEETTYQALLTAVRRQIAQTSLRRADMTLCDVAFLLGFADQSAFSHAFKRWTGMTPRAYRKAWKA